MSDLMKTFRIGDSDVKLFGEDLVSLTDLWKSVGGSKNQRPAHWLQGDDVESFVNTVTCNLNVPRAYILQSQRGRTGGTYAHWQIALAYAKYLSPELHMQMNEVFRGFIEANPSMTADMIGRTEDERDVAALGGKVIDKAESPETLKWIARRAENKNSTKSLQATIKQVLPTADGHVYSTVMNINNKAVTGQKAAKIREERGVSKNKTRDSFTLTELSEMTVLQGWDIQVLEKAKPSRPSKWNILADVQQVADVFMEAKQKLGIAI